MRKPSSTSCLHPVDSSRSRAPVHVHTFARVCWAAGRTHAHTRAHTRTLPSQSCLSAAVRINISAFSRQVDTCIPGDHACALVSRSTELWHWAPTHGMMDLTCTDKGFPFAGSCRHPRPRRATVQQQPATAIERAPHCATRTAVTMVTGMSSVPAPRTSCW